MILIVGGGRSGTSFLVKVLTLAGLSTGFTEDEVLGKVPGYGIDEGIRAGLENPHASAGTSADIIKSPKYSFCIDAWSKTTDIPFKNKMNIEHVIIPIRDLETSARSRIDVGLTVTKVDSKAHVAAGRSVWNFNTDLSGQIGFQAASWVQAIFSCEFLDIPYTLIHFPKLVDSYYYCYLELRKAIPMLDTDKFHAAHMTARTGWTKNYEQT